MLSSVECRCRVENWEALRLALRLSGRQMALLLCLSERECRYIRHSHRHICVRQANLVHLRAWLRHPELRRRLAEAGYPYPWPEDLPHAPTIEHQAGEPARTG